MFSVVILESDLIDSGSALAVGVRRSGEIDEGHPPKVQTAKEVRTKTSVSLSFVARELRMGSPMYVSKLPIAMIKGKKCSPRDALI